MRKKTRPGGGGTLRAPVVTDTMRSSESSVFTVNASGTMRASTLVASDVPSIGNLIYLLFTIIKFKYILIMNRTIRNNATCRK